jgi:hypothetical protein
VISFCYVFKIFFLSANAIAPGCFFRRDDAIGAEQKLAGSENGFLPAPLNLDHPEPADTHADLMAVFCLPILSMADLWFLFS